MFLLICVKGALDAASLQNKPGNKVLMENLVLSAFALGQQRKKPGLPLSETCRCEEEECCLSKITSL